MKSWLKKITGIERLQKERAEAIANTAEAKIKAEEAKREEELAKMTAKDRATARNEPYIAVLDTKVNPDNIRNGFFELDWNEHFIVQLKQAGYGLAGDPEEEIVDRWFRQLCADVANEDGVDMTDRGVGYINVKKIAENKSEVS
jgi:hypothetical protein